MWYQTYTIIFSLIIKEIEEVNLENQLLMIMTQIGSIQKGFKARELIDEIQKRWFQYQDQEKELQREYDICLYYM